MDTISARASYLLRLMDFLVSDIMPPDVKQRLQISADNKYGGDDLELQKKHASSITRLVEDISRLIALPEEAARCFNNAPLVVRQCLYERYCFAGDILKERFNKVLTVPKSLDGLFRWFFIELWERPPR